MSFLDMEPKVASSKVLDLSGLEVVGARSGSREFPVWQVDVVMLPSVIRGSLWVSRSNRPIKKRLFISSWRRLC